MAINMRQGADADFDPTKLTAGEFAFLHTSKKIAAAFADGTVKNIQTEEDAEEFVSQASEAASLAKDAKKTAEQQVGKAYDYMFSASQSASAAGQNAGIAEQKVIEVVEIIKEFQEGGVIIDEYELDTTVTNKLNEIN